MKTISGIVVSDKMQKTAVVEVVRYVAHPIYRKRIRRTTKYHAHNEVNAKVGDLVSLIESNPISKTKTWKVKEVTKAYGTT